MNFQSVKRFFGEVIRPQESRAGTAKNARMMKIDQYLIFAGLALLFLGLTMVYSASIALPDSPKYANYMNEHFFIRQSIFIALGLFAGLMVFHPWRQKIDRWVFSPHFHVILYGYLDVQQFLDDNPGWLIKVIHAREEIRSVRHTIAYLETHAGLPLAERDPDEVDWANLCWSEMLAAFTSDFSVSDVNLKTGQKLGTSLLYQHLLEMVCD